MLIDPLKDILNEQNGYIKAKTILLHVTDMLWTDFDEVNKPPLGSPTGLILKVWRDNDKLR